MRRIARGLGVVALATVALVALLVGSAFTVLRTSWGADRLKRLAVPRINDAIAGSVQLGRFSFGGDHLALQDLVLRDPEGGVVLRVRALEAAFDPLALLRRRFRIGQLTVTEPSLFLRQDLAGLNLSRALAARAPGAPEAAGPKPGKSSTASGGLSVDLADLRVAGGSVELRSTPPVAGRAAWRVSALAVDGEAHYDAGPATFVVSLQARALVQEPLQARLNLQIAGRGSGDRRELAVRSDLGDSSIAADVRTESATRGTLQLSRLHVAPELVRTLVPGIALLIPIDMTARVVREASAFSFGTDVKTTAGTLEAHGTVDTSAARVRPVTVSATGVDLGRIIEGWPRSKLSLTARGEGTGRDPQTVSGTVAIEMPVGQVNGASVGPLAIRLTATGGQYEVAELHVALPGATIRGHGPVGPARVALEVGVEARDLGLTSRTLSSFRGLQAPPFSGRGKVDVSLSGTTLRPSVQVSARFPRLAVGDDRVTDLKLEAQAPDARTPEVANADLQVVDARVAGRIFHRASVRLRSGAGRLDADVQLGGPTPLSLVAGGTWGADHQSFELDQLRLRYPEAAWTMAGRAFLSWRPEHLAVTGLDLRAGRQRIRLSLGEHGSHLRAKVTLEEIDLGRLPRIALPPGKAVGGRLDLDGELEAKLKGGFSQPVARVKMNLRNGRLDAHRDLALAIDGHYRGGRVVGRLGARGFDSRVEARFDLPTEWPLADARGPLTLDLTVPETELAAVLAAADVRLRRRIGGRVGIVLHLQGTASAPVLHLDTTARGLVVDGQSLGDLALRVSGDARAPVVVALNVGPSARFAAGPPAARSSDQTPRLCAGSIEVRTDLSLASLTHRLPSATELTGMHFDVTGNLAGIPLQTLAGLAQSTEVSGGSASLRVSASGTARAPTGTLNLQLAGATGPRFPPTDARLDAAFGEQDARMALRILRKGRELASASGILGVASRRLKDLGALTKAPLTLTAAVGPLHLRRDAIPGTFGPTGSEALSADLRATLSVDGTLARPKLRLSADLSNGRIGARPLGAGRILVTYARQEAGADVQVRSAGKGELRLTNRTTIDLGYPQVTAGVDLDNLVLDARLTAEHFDLGLLSGVTKEVRKVGGELSATVTARGPARAPHVNGQMEWTNGVLSLLGLGDYAKIHLKAHGDETAVWLDELRLASGEGNARVTGQASRHGDRDYDLQTSASLRQFPVYGQGEVLALISIDGAVKGRLSPDELKASARVSEAHVELTDAKQKNLQSLARPADVILVDDGEPVNRNEATKLAALTDDLSGGTGTAAASAVGAPTSFRVQLGVDAPRNLWVRGKDASIELGVGPDFRVEVNGPPRIYGHVIIRRGRIDVLGRRFDLQAGSLIRFIGPAEAPTLDVSAKYLNETENITVLLTARGALDKLTIAVSSPDRPDLTEGQLYTLIVTGRLQLGGNTAGSTGVSGEAASLVGGIVAAQLQKTLAKRLPLDVLTLQAGEGLTGSRLEAGTYLTSKLYAGYVGRVGANPALLQNRNAVHVEYQLSRRWSFDGEYGDVGTGTADILWTKHY